MGGEKIKERKITISIKHTGEKSRGTSKKKKIKK
jgi:hypothetical protein